MRKTSGTLHEMEGRILGNNLYLLEKNINASKLSFNKEINLLEFVEIIGKMDISHHTNYKKRDIFLKKLGKQLFKKHPLQNNKKSLKNIHQTSVYSQSKIDDLLYNNKIHETKIFSQEEIDMLLTPINKQQGQIYG
jgi:hypothetical protein